MIPSSMGLRNYDIVYVIIMEYDNVDTTVYAYICLYYIDDVSER